MANAREIGARLIAMADEVVRGANAQKGSLAGALADASNYLAQLKLAVEEPTSEVADMLGEDHPGTTAIVGVTAAVTDQIEPMHELVQKMINDLETLGGLIDNLGWTYNNVGGDISRAGGGL